MKWNNKLIAWMALPAMLLAACQKDADLPFYENGTAVTASSSATAVSAPAADSSKVVLTISWTNPNYASNENTFKYLVQIDSAGRNFSKAVTREVVGKLSTDYTAKELNDIMLGFGFNFNQKYPLDIRVISSYNNNNERYNSNLLRVDGTPYKIPPKVLLPASGTVFIVGSGSEFGWSNDAGQPFNVARSFSRVDETTFIGVFNLFGGDQYLILPEYGNWNKKYALDKNNVPGIANGGPFGYHEEGNPAYSGFNDNFVTPATTGLYKITLDFQRGVFTVAPFTQQHGLPSALVVVGDGTPQDWNNAANNPYKFTRKNSTLWEQTVTLTAGKDYLILPKPGDWGQKYGVADNSKPEAKLAGKVVPEGSNFKTPDATGSYKITVDFSTNDYKVVKQ